MLKVCKNPSCERSGYRPLVYVSTANFCSKCGTELGEVPPPLCVCGVNLTEPLSWGANYCTQCGRPIPRAAVINVPDTALRKLV